MKLINSSFEIYDQKPGLEGIYEAIEYAGRTCYKSTRPEGQTAKDFVDRMIASKHLAMCEHGTIYLTIPNDHDICLVLKLNPYTKCNPVNNVCYATTNLRVLVEHEALWLLKYMCEPTEHHEKRYTVKLICDRGVSHEFVRHRTFSFAQESSRYCNYAKNRFNNELTFIIPSWTNLPEQDYGNSAHPKVFNKGYANGVETAFVDSLRIAENYYFNLLNEGWKPQQARAVLPNAIKTELVMTGFISDWIHFFDLRAIGTTGAPHPDAKALAEPLMVEIMKRRRL